MISFFKATGGLFDLLAQFFFSNKCAGTIGLGIWQTPILYTVIMIQWTLIFKTI
jgi:hypothetical protein